VHFNVNIEIGGTKNKSHQKDFYRNGKNNNKKIKNNYYLYYEVLHLLLSFNKSAYIDLYSSMVIIPKESMLDTFLNNIVIISIVASHESIKFI